MDGHRSPWHYRLMENTQKQQTEWNQEAYLKQKKICSKLTNKGLRVALNQKTCMTPEAIEAYKDTLRERGENIK